MFILSHTFTQTLHGFKVEVTEIFKANSSASPGGKYNTSQFDPIT